MFGGNPTAGIYGYTHAFCGYAGSHAEYICVPFADNDCFHVPDGVADDTALFLSDAAPTGYIWAPISATPHLGDTAAVWGASPSG
ncbi:threonine dehydrogenase-like Zn-dependent dehydrogenase [Xanthobacter flavus]|nr:threonine dehydrogenase-like Zn-dependent dehydrogenase [Xanthobacter flavus]